MAICAIIFVHGVTDNGIGCRMAVIAGAVGGIYDKPSGNMIWGSMVEEVCGMGAVAGAAGIGRTVLTMTDSRSL